MDVVLLADAAASAMRAELPRWGFPHAGCRPGDPDWVATAVLDGRLMGYAEARSRWPGATGTGALEVTELAVLAGADRAAVGHRLLAALMPLARGGLAWCVRPESDRDLFAGLGWVDAASPAGELVLIRSIPQT